MSDVTIGTIEHLNERRPWTERDLEVLASLYFSTSNAKLRPYDEMVEVLGRSKVAILTEISRRGMAAPGAKLRVCLGVECEGRRKFFSAAPGHRICPRCAAADVYRCAS